LLVLAAAAALGAVAAPAPGIAKEESKLQIALDPVAGPSGGGWRNAKLRTRFMTGEAVVHVQVKGLLPLTEYGLHSDGVEITRFTTTDKGGANVKLDLLQMALATGDLAAAPVDPRGTFVTVNDGVADVLGGWLFGPVELDPSRAKAKEVTHLMPDALAAPTGSAKASYKMTPNGKATLRISLGGAPAGDYEVWIGGALVGTLTTNPAGNASVEFRSSGAGNGKSKKKLAMAFDPRLELIELLQGGAPVFSGVMAAQIGGLNVCLESEIAAALSLAAGQVAGAGSMSFGTEADCSRTFAMEVSDLVAGAYDVVVADVVVGSMAVAADGTGSVHFDTSPDDLDELPLDFSLPSGAAIALEQGGVQVLVGIVP
jgi:hypothetical protein